MKNKQSKETRKFYDRYLVILLVLTIAYCIFVFFTSGGTSFERGESFMIISVIGYILLTIASFHFIYTLMVKIAGGDMGYLGYAILTSAIIPGISPLLFYVFVFRKFL